MLAVLQDLGLEKYIVADAKLPELANRSKPTPEELETQKKWQEGDTYEGMHPNQVSNQ